jgi:hypothetical protein
MLSIDGTLPISIARIAQIGDARRGMIQGVPQVARISQISYSMGGCLWVYRHCPCYPHAIRTASVPIGDTAPPSPLLPPVAFQEG